MDPLFCTWGATLFTMGKTDKKCLGYLIVFKMVKSGWRTRSVRDELQNKQNDKI